MKKDLEELKSLPHKELKVRREERERHHKVQAKSKLHDKCKVFDELELAGEDEVLREWKARQRPSTSIDEGGRARGFLSRLRWTRKQSPSATSAGQQAQIPPSSTHTNLEGVPRTNDPD